jgi:hypothetical protein
MSQRTDPHAETAYWVIPLDKEAFAVEVITPWNYPTTVSTFPSAADAKAWIAAHRRRVQSSVGFESPVTAVPTVAFLTRPAGQIVNAWRRTKTETGLMTSGLMRNPGPSRTVEADTAPLAS